MIVIFKVYIFSRIFKKRELSENIYNAKNSTFTVCCTWPALKLLHCIIEHWQNKPVVEVFEAKTLIHYFSDGVCFNQLM